MTITAAAVALINAKTLNARALDQIKEAIDCFEGGFPLVGASELIKLRATLSAQAISISDARLALNDDQDLDNRPTSALPTWRPEGGPR